METTMKDQFENFILSNNPHADLSVDDNGDYIDEATQVAWTGCKALLIVG